jgi:hypothetical protein
MEKERLFSSGMFLVLSVFGILNLHSYGWVAILFLYLLLVAFGLYAYLCGLIEW